MATMRTRRDIQDLVDARGYDEPQALRVLAALRVMDFIVSAQETMEKEKLTAAELARRIGVDRSQITRWLHAEGGMTASSMHLIAQGLGYDLHLKWRRSVTAYGEKLARVIDIDEKRERVPIVTVTYEPTHVSEAGEALAV